MLGRTVTGKLDLHVPAELGVLFEAGTRTGKTMAWAIPAVLAAWGAVVATSNRPDLFRHTQGGRTGKDREIWVSDLQAVTGQVECGFWVDLLSRVATISEARKLASFFVSAAKDPGARVDSYFDGGAQELLSLYILAAACAGGDLLHVVDWLGHDQDQTPALILKAHGKRAASQRVVDTQSLYARQRDGLYDMARRFCNVLTDECYALMVTPPRRKVISAHEGSDGQVQVDVEFARDTVHDLREFDPVDFVTSSDTLYLMSKEGPDSAAALSGALVGQILEAALRVARQRPDGRLRVPLLAVLDEAANCCPISALPNYYTYAGGHGVILMTFLQMLEQGEDLWGKNGLSIIRGQSIEVYGGGIGDTAFLRQWSDLAGEHDVSDPTHSYGTQGGRNRSVSWRSEPVLTVDQLSALDKSRALVRFPGHRPILVQKVPWYESQYAPIVHASLAEFE